MKKIIILLSLFLLGAASAGSAAAISYTDTHEENKFLRGWALDTAEWDFDITSGDDGFKPLTRQITSASVSLNLKDDAGCDFREFAFLSVGMNNFLWEVDSGDASFQINSLMTLNNTGRIHASLTAVFGDFYFDSAILTAIGEAVDVVAAAASPIPEPTAMLLFGTGIVGLSFATRRRLFLMK